MLRIENARQDSTPRRARVRIRYVALAAVTIALGLIVNRRGEALSPVVRDVLGDTLWAVMMVWWVAAIAPATGWLSRGAVALACCFAVEFSQLLHTPALDAIRETTVGHLVLGSGFDPRDLAAYAAGVIVASVIGRAINAEHSNR